MRRKIKRLSNLGKSLNPLQKIAQFYPYQIPNPQPPFADYSLPSPMLSDVYDLPDLSGETPGDFFFRDLTLNDITYGTLLKFSSQEAINKLSFGNRVVHPHHMEINSCEFRYTGGYQGEHFVRVLQLPEGMYLSCTCGESTKNVCDHQSIVLYQVMENTSFRVFYDAEKRVKVLRDHAINFGITDPKTIDDTFGIELRFDKIEIIPKIPELLGLNEETTLKIEKRLLPQTFSPEESITTSENGFFLLFHSPSYTNGCVVKWMSSPLTKDRLPKNPLQTENALQEVLQRDNPEELKAFAAIGLLQQEYRNSSDIQHITEHEFKTDIKALSALKYITNTYPVYQIIDATGNLKANNLEEVQLNASALHLQLFVNKHDDFFEITGEVEVENHVIPLENLKIKHRYFVQRGMDLYLIKNWDYLRTINYFQLNYNKLIIHEALFETFQQDYLFPLENRVSIQYTHLKKATKKIIAQSDLAKVTAVRIYLTDSENFIHITPVVQYGDMEIPILTRRKLFTLDQTGTSFEIPRQESIELRALGSILQLHPDFEDQLSGEFFYLHKKAFTKDDWFLDAFELWNNSGYEILGFQNITKQRISMQKMVVKVQVISGLDWFETRTEVKVGKETVRLKEIQKSVLQRSRYVKLGDGSMGILPKEWLERFGEYFRAGEFIEDEIRIPKSMYGFIDEWFEAAQIDEQVRTQIDTLKAKIESFESIPDTALPIKLEAELRSYQKEGYNWLHFLEDFGFGGILADDMGLGKTIQVLAYLSKIQESAPEKTHLVVVPTSLLFNWLDELAKFAPHLKVLSSYGNSRVKGVQAFENVDIVLTTYGTLLSDIRFFKDFTFDTIILDEAQAIKNPESKRFKTMRMLNGRQRLALTGTPVENNTLDLYAILSFCNPGMLGNLKRFKDDYATPIDKFQDGKRAKELQQKVHPYILRRTKKQVATELPEKTEMVIYCAMGNEQRRVYDTYKKELKDFLMKRRVFDDSDSTMHVLRGLTKLRQICNSPAILNENGVSYGEESAKIVELMEQLESKTPHHKVLVFSQFVTMLDEIKRALDQRNIKYAYLTGKTKDRKEVVDSFQNNPEIRVFLISLKAGGMGLNLTEAEYVYLVDPWWNPAVENQAIDRAYRIGQHKKVVAIRLITPDSVEEKIMQLQERKHDLVKELVHTDTGLLKRLDKADLLSLL